MDGHQGRAEGDHIPGDEEFRVEMNDVMKDEFNFSNKFVKKPPIETQSLSAFRQTSWIDVNKNSPKIPEKSRAETVILESVRLKLEKDDRDHGPQRPRR